MKQIINYGRHRRGGQQGDQLTWDQIRVFFSLKTSLDLPLYTILNLLFFISLYLFSTYFGTIVKFWVCRCKHNVPVNSKTAHAPPRANPGAFDSFEKFWSNSPLCCQFRRSNAPPLELQTGSNPPPSRHVKATVETGSAKFQPLRISCSACFGSTL